MVDMQSISVALASIKTATDIAKLFKDTDVSFEKAEAKLKLAELISALADAKIQIADIQQSLIDKDAELRTAQEQLVIKANLKWEPPYYWLLNGTKKDGPYCQCCYDKDKKLIRLQGDGDGFWSCNVCNSSYRDSSYRLPPGSDPYLL
jgi:hypothetical protein